MLRRLQAPTAHNAVLAEPNFDAVPDRVEANRRRLDRSDVRIGSVPLNEFRAAARRQALQSFGAPTGGPLLIAGHQPELSHPGVWVKSFALNGLAKKLQGVPLNLIVDNDAIKQASLKVPSFSTGDASSVHLETVPFDRIPGKPAYEGYLVRDRELFATFAERVSHLTRNWGYRPLILDAWATASQSSQLVETLTALRGHYEYEWGCRNCNLPVSRLSATPAFHTFAGHILSDLARFRTAYNAAIRIYREKNRIRSAVHPVPELSMDEAPFWEITGTGRRAWTSRSTAPQWLRPRALTLTLFARLCLGDFFIHGIGGGKYDEVTDAIIRDYFGIEPPEYQVLSATLHLPLPGFTSTIEDQHRAEQAVRDMHWNPQRYVDGAELNDPRVLRIVADRISEATNEPPRTERQARKDWFRSIQELNVKLRPFVATQQSAAQANRERIEAEVRANAVLERRDYSWVLYPEETLRPFLQSFLTL